MLTPVAERLRSFDLERDLMRADGVLLNLFGNFFTSAIQLVVEAIVILAIALYLAFAPALYRNGILHLVPTKYKKRVASGLRCSAHAIEVWMLARLGSMVLVGILTFLGLWFLGMPAAVALALIAALLSFIPNLGPFLSMVPAALIAFTVSPIMVLYVVALYLGVQFIESYFLTPIMQQEFVSLPPALLLGGQLLLAVWFGIYGLLLAAPLLAVTIALHGANDTAKRSLRTNAT